MSNYFTPESLSLAGCGFLGIYHVGVLACLQKHAPYYKYGTISGASAGAMAGVYFLCDVPPEKAIKDILEFCRVSRQHWFGLFNPKVDVSRIIRKSLETRLPLDAHLRVSGKIQISITRLSDFKNVIATEFETREELIDAILCSGFIPVACGWSPPEFKGVRYVDAGFSDNQPMVDEGALKVSPFAGESDICPRDHINLNSVVIANTSFQVSTRNLTRGASAIFPPTPEELFAISEQGFEDTLQFLLKNNRIGGCSSCNDGNNNLEFENPALKSKSGHVCQSCTPTKDRGQKYLKLRDTIPEEYFLNKIFPKRIDSKSSILSESVEIISSAGFWLCRKIWKWTCST